MKESELKPLVSIIILAYNNIDHTKLCIESLYRSSSHINFELITVNNGSTDGTQEFFNSLSNKKKINIPSNCGVDKAFNMGFQLAEGEFFVFISNDLVLTPNWLDNLLKCAQSDERIGMAVPVCNFSSNFQQVSLAYGSIEELYQAADKYNKSDPKKWEERLRLITYAFISKTGLMKKLGGYDEIYNPYAFDDDDLSFRIRREGYRLILAKDTYVHHFGSVTKRNDCVVDYLLERNRRIFSARFGVDAWDDAGIDFEMLKLIDFNRTNNVNILGIGLCCGGTLLQAKNRFREKGCTDVRLWGLTEDEKYLEDLKTVCDHVVCDWIEDIQNIYKDIQFDCIMIGCELQDIEDPEAFIRKIAGLIKEDGQLIFPLSNELFHENIMNLLSGNTDSSENPTVSRYLKPDRLIKVLRKYGYQQIKYYMQKVELPEAHAALPQKLKDISQMENTDTLKDILCTKRFIFSAGDIKTVRKVLFYPGYDFWKNDRVFDDKSLVNLLGVDTGGNFAWALREEFRKCDYEMSTIDNPEDMDSAEFFIFNDMPKHYANPFFTGRYHEVYKGKIYFDEFLKRRAQGKTEAKLIVRLNEPHFVMPENFDRNVHKYIDMIFTYCDDLVDNKKYFKYFIPQPEKVENPFVKSFNGKKLFTFIGSNKWSCAPGELYSERRRAIEFFENHHREGFDLYGRQWEDLGYKSYKGEIKNKLEVLSAYKFDMCYENGILNGWISERIFECFFAGCVPVYLGAPNITDYIPANTFIDKREFGSYEHLYGFISSMSEERYNEYLDNIKSFLKSEGYKKFTRGCSAKNMVSTILQK